MRRPLRANWCGLLIDPHNYPEARPGVYLLTHLASGQRYVGATRNVRQRLYEHAKKCGGVQQINDLMKPYAFFAQPLYYALGSSRKSKRELGLVTIEEQLIEAYDCYKSLNQKRADVAKLSKLPEAMHKRLATEQTAATRQRRSSEMLRRYADPAYCAKHLENVRAANANPERKLKIAASRLGLKWITNSTIERAIRDEQVPIGWRYGQKRSSRV